MKKRLCLGIFCLGLTLALPSAGEEPLKDEAIKTLNESFIAGQSYIEGLAAYTEDELARGKVHEAILKAKEPEALPLEEKAYHTWRLVGVTTIYVKGERNRFANYASTATSELLRNSFKPQYLITGDNKFGFQAFAAKKLKQTGLQAWGKMSQERHRIRPYTNLACEQAHKVAVYQYEYLKKGWWGVKRYRAEVYGKARTTTWFVEQAIKPDKGRK